MDSVSVVDAKKNFSELMAKIAYTGQRIVVERRGKPMMAWVSIEDLRRLEATQDSAEEKKKRRLAALARADAFRAQIRAKRKGEWLPDSSELLNELREGRMNELSGLR